MSDIDVWSSWCFVSIAIACYVSPSSRALAQYEMAGRKTDVNEFRSFGGRQRFLTYTWSRRISQTSSSTWCLGESPPPGYFCGGRDVEAEECGVFCGWSTWHFDPKAKYSTWQLNFESLRIHHALEISTIFHPRQLRYYVISLDVNEFRIFLSLMHGVNSQ